MDKFFEKLGSKVAATMGAGPSVEVLINEIADQLEATIEEDGLGNDSKTRPICERVKVASSGFGPSCRDRNQS